MTDRGGGAEKRYIHTCLMITCLGGRVHHRRPRRGARPTARVHSEESCIPLE